MSFRHPVKNLWCENSVQFAMGIIGHNRASSLAFLLLIAWPGHANRPEQFPFDAKLGVAVSSGNYVCLSIHNEELKPGDRLWLVTTSHPQSVIEAKVQKKDNKICPIEPTMDDAFDRYELALKKGKLSPSLPAIAVYGFNGTLSSEPG